MPEGPELHCAAKFVNSLCADRIFTGNVVKSEVSTKNPDVPWTEEAYIISATARGKEVKLTLRSVSGNDNEKKKKSNNKKQKKEYKSNKSENHEEKSLDILFRFGMSGKFQFVPVDEKAKHAHLNFFTAEGDMVLSFVDYRRFGRWVVNGDWGKDRGPCILTEAERFRNHVLSNLHVAAFNKPICEVLLDQKHFNGIGNYLRAEILYRLEIPPFTCARTVLQPLKTNADANIKRELPDILDLCHSIPMEVYNLNEGRGHLYSPEDDADGFEAFSRWLQCYYQPDMNNLVDHNGRTIWFKGPAGSMIPKEKKSRERNKKSKLNKKTLKETKTEEEEDDGAPPVKKARNTRGQVEKKKNTENAHKNTSQKMQNGKKVKVSKKVVISKAKPQAAKKSNKAPKKTSTNRKAHSHSTPVRRSGRSKTTK